MEKYSIKRILFCTLIIFLCASVINAEEDYEDLDIVSSSLESKSKEIYNYTSKEKPSKRVYESQDWDSDDNSLSDSMDNSVSIDKNNSTNMEAVTPITKFRPKPINIEKSFSKFSFTVTIQKLGAHYATGALVDKKWILSVAELFYNVRESIKLYMARLGSLNCKKGGTLLHLKAIEIHPDYKYKQPKFDLALLRIAETEADIIKSIHPISLAMFNGNELKTIYWSTYWPRLIVEGNVLSSLANERYQQNIMRISYQDLIPWNTCQHMLEKWNIILHESNICLQPITSHHSRCMPDPGAPIVADNYLWGVTSGWTSTACLKQTSPTIVTGMYAPSVLSWFYSTLKK